jgi:hypothetical protein
MPCEKIGNLEVEKKLGMKVSEELTDNEITYVGENL